jgi:CRISPR-associated protein Cas2
MRLEREIKPGEDHVLILDIGPADQVDLRMESLGRTVEVIRREAVVI